MPVVTTLATLAGLLWYLCATYWGPMLVSDPDADVAVCGPRLAAALVVALPGGDVRHGDWWQQWRSSLAWSRSADWC